MTKTISALNEKMWYRALKVINVLFVITCWLYAIAAIIFSFTIIFLPDYRESLGISSVGLNILIAILTLIFAPLLAWFISEVPKRIFYYIVLGTIKPEK